MYPFMYYSVTSDSIIHVHCISDLNQNKPTGSMLHLLMINYNIIIEDYFFLAIKVLCRNMTH
jgi:hypothetical protein